MVRRCALCSALGVCQLRSLDTLHLLSPAQNQPRPRTQSERVSVTTFPTPVHRSECDAAGLLSIPDLLSRLKNRKEICDRADCAIRADVRRSIYQVVRAEKTNVAVECGWAKSRAPRNINPNSRDSCAVGWLSGMRHGDRLCSAPLTPVFRVLEQHHLY